MAKNVVFIRIFNDLASSKMAAPSHSEKVLDTPEFTYTGRLCIIDYETFRREVFAKSVHTVTIYMYPLLMMLILLFPALSGAAEPVTQSFSHTVYLQPYSKLRQAAEQGDAQAQYDLAYLYYKSGIDPEITGVTRSERQAAHWYREAAMRGHPSAQYNMAVLHLQGHGVDRDAIVAYAWLLLASGNGHEASNELIAELDGLLNTRQIEEAHVRSAALQVSKPRPEFAQDN